MAGKIHEVHLSPTHVDKGGGAQPVLVHRHIELCVEEVSWKVQWALS